MSNRPILGFIIAPLAPCLVASIAVCFSRGDLAAIPIAMFLYALFAYPFSLVFGVPIYLLFSRLGYISMWQVVVAGTILGFISGATLPFIMGVEWKGAMDSDLISTALLFAIFGAITAWAFWWVALRPRTNNQLNQDAPKSGAPEL